jgi:ribulose-bisphosphate carboxylase small chain
MMTNPTGRITQGQFSFLPDLTTPRSRLQIEYGLRKGYAWSVEYTDDPHPRNTYWEMYGMPMFDLNDAAGVLLELQACRKTFPSHYIRMMAFDATRGVESIAMSFIVNRPPNEPGFGLVRQEGPGPLDALHGAQLRHRQARRPSATEVAPGPRHESVALHPARGAQPGRRTGRA